MFPLFKPKSMRQFSLIKFLTASDFRIKRLNKERDLSHLKLYLISSFKLICFSFLVAFYFKYITRNDDVEHKS